MRINSRSAPANSFFTYLSVELNKVIGA